MKYLLLLLWCLQTAWLSTYGQSSAPDARVALLAARGDVFRLRPLYDSISHQLLPHTDLYCRLAMARATGNHTQIVALIDSLEQQHERRFDVRGLLAMAGERCASMLALGDYEQLSQYCQERLSWAKRRSIRKSRQQDLKSYLNIAQQLREQLPLEVEWQQQRFSIPLTRDWPLLVPVSINGEHPAPFLIDTGHRHTLISQTDASEWGIIPLHTSLRILTAKGWIEAHPALLPQLQIGEITIKHLLIFVTDDEIDAPFNRSIGTTVLQQLRHITITDHHLLVNQIPPISSLPAQPFALTPEGGISLNDETESQTLLLDVAQADTISSAALKGVNYLRTSTQSILDFTRHQFHYSPNRSYSPLRVDDYLQRGDYFSLLRNEASLSFTASSEQVARMTAALNSCLDPQLALSQPQGIPSPTAPFVVTPPSVITEIPYVSIDSHHISVALGQQSLVAQCNPLHPLSQISTTAIKQLGLSVHRDAQGRQWTYINKMQLGTAIIENLCCLVYTSSQPLLTVGLDVLTRLSAVQFGQHALTLFPARHSFHYHTATPYLTTRSGLLLDATNDSTSESRLLQKSDYDNKIIDFVRMQILD